MKTKDFCYLLRVDVYEVTTDYIDVGNCYTWARMPKDCFAGFILAKQHGIVAYRRGGHIWLQIRNEYLHKINHCYSACHSWEVERYFPKRETIYSKPMYSKKEG